MNEHIPGTKIAERLFARPEGATMAEVVAATGGRQHNLLERLKAKGYAVRSRKEGNTTRYWARPPAAPSFVAKMSAKGQVTIPKEVRERLHTRAAGDKVRFVFEPGGGVTVHRGTGTIDDLVGILGKPKRHFTLEELDEGMRRAVTQRYLRAVGRK